MPFVKLDTGILDSSLWMERDQRDLFITALCMALPYELVEPAEELQTEGMEKTGFIVPKGWYGIVRASSLGIIGRSRLDTTGIPLAELMEELRTLSQPDPWSRDDDFEGRRMVRITGGFIILNYGKYRDLDRTNTERQKRFRKRYKALRAVTKPLVNVTQPLRNAIEEEEEEEKKKIPSIPTQSEKGGDILATGTAITKGPLQNSKYPPFEVFKQFCHYHVVNELGEEDTYNWPAYFDFFEGIGWRTANGEPIAKWKPYVRMGIRKGWHKDKDQPEPYVTVEMVKEYCQKKNWKLEDYAWGQLMHSKYFGKPITNRQDFRAAMEAIGSQWSRENR